MQASLHRALSCIFAGCALVASAPASAIALIVNGGFESGFTGWSLVDQLGSDGTFFVQTGTASPVNAFVVPSPPGGAQAAMTDQSAGGSHVLYQDFVVPASVASGSISFSLFVNSGDDFRDPVTLDWATPELNQQARVDIIAASADPFSVAAADVLLNLFQTVPGGPLVSGYDDDTIDITALLQAHAGQTLRLRFAEVDNVSFLNFGVDNVAIDVTPGGGGVVPAPATWLLAAAALPMLLRRRRAD